MILALLRWLRLVVIYSCKGIDQNFTHKILELMLRCHTHCARLYNSRLNTVSKINIEGFKRFNVNQFLEKLSVVLITNLTEGMCHWASTHSKSSSGGQAFYKLVWLFFNLFSSIRRIFTVFRIMQSWDVHWIR